MGHWNNYETYYVSFVEIWSFIPVSVSMTRCCSAFNQYTIITDLHPQRTAVLDKLFGLSYKWRPANLYTFFSSISVKLHVL